ncbi:atrial natriuretic peptide receptor 1, partial [Biomphalaria pfeifferi]
MTVRFVCYFLLVGTGYFKTSLVESTVVYLAVLLPHGTQFPFTIMKARPAIDVTITRLQHKGIFTKDTVKVLYADSKCSSTYAPIEAFNFRSGHRINAFLGPVCDFALSPVGRYAAVWKTPIISPGGFSHTFQAEKK